MAKLFFRTTSYLLVAAVILTFLLVPGCRPAGNIPAEHEPIEESPAAPSPATLSPAAPSPTASDTGELITEQPIYEPTLYPDTAYAQLSNTMQAWGFKKEKGKRPQMPDSTNRMFAEFGAVYAGHGDKKVLYLTFDEGYENGYTPKILDTLKKTNTPAAFFITGDYLKKQPELVQRMVREGHIVGNHTYNHPSMPSVTSNQKLAEEITRLADEFTALTGQTMKYLRPPKGEYSECTLAITKDLGYTTVFWSFAYADWLTDKQQGADYAYSQVMPYLHNGAILLLHAVSKDNAEALERIIADARALGYEFASLDEL